MPAAESQNTKRQAPPALLWALLYYVAFVRALPAISLTTVIVVGVRALRRRRRA